MNEEQYINLYNIVNKFIKLIDSEYPISTSIILYKLEEKKIYKDIYYTIGLLIEIENYRRIEYFDVLFDEIIDFNTIYQQVHLIITEMIEQIGI